MKKVIQYIGWILCALLINYIAISHIQEELDQKYQRRLEDCQYKLDKIYAPINKMQLKYDAAKDEVLLLEKQIEVGFPKKYDVNILKKKAAELLNEGWSDEKVQRFVDAYKARYNKNGSITVVDRKQELREYVKKMMKWGVSEESIREHIKEFSKKHNITIDDLD